MIIPIVAALVSSPIEMNEMRALDRSAACLIRKDRVGAAKLASTRPGSGEEVNAAASMRQLILRCYPDHPDLKVIDAVALRLMKEFARTITVYRHDDDDTSLEANAILDSSNNQPVKQVTLHCITVIRPDQSNALIASKIGSEAEGSAIGSLLALLPRCVRSGEVVSWRPLDLRLGAARWLYLRYDVFGAIIR